MADESTCQLGEAHAPLEESLKVYRELLPEIRKKVVSLRNHYEKHDVTAVRAAEGVSDTELAHSIKEDGLIEVRVGTVAYGLFVFGKVKVLDGTKVVIVRLFVGTQDGQKVHKLHSIFTGNEGGDRELFWNDDVSIEFFSD